MHKHDDVRIIVREEKIRSNKASVEGGDSFQKHAVISQYMQQLGQHP